DFFQSGQAAAYAVDGGLTKEAHALFLRQLADFRGGLLFEDQLADGISEIEQLVNRSTATVAGATALDAARAFAEIEGAPLLRIEAGGEQGVLVIVNGADAVLADGTNQPLGQDAVECGDEVVGLDAHVEEAAEYVDHVVGVDGGEDQVAGERRIDGDLGGFLVTDFADEDLVGIMAQDGAQSAGEREAFFLVDR